jgi:hypothetical protein
MVRTTTTAIPKPNAAEIFFETARKVHMPKNQARAMFSMKTARTKRLK